MSFNFVQILILLLVFQFVNSILYPYEPRNPLSKNPNPPGSPWPLPRIWLKYPELVSISKFKFVPNFANYPNLTCEPLDFIIDKYEDYYFNFIPIETPDKTYPLLSRIDIDFIPSSENNYTIIGCESFPVFSDDPNYEAYNLTIVGISDTEANGRIVAHTLWGALRGIDTFSQLIWSNLDYDDYHYYLNYTEISDWPRFSHRGVMIDTARHYLPIETITTVLDGLLYNKFNVLQIHMVDDQSFPYVSKRFPELSQMGAYKNGMLVYTPEDINQITNDARLRGIRVLFEFDSPGHTHGFGKSHPELLTPCYGDGVNPGTPNFPYHAARENFDPTNEKVYEFMREFFTEIVNEISRDEYIHLGMDEVYEPCWQSSPEIAQFMVENNYTKISDVQGHYTQRHVKMIKEIGAIPISWQDPLDAGVNLDKDVIIQVWKDFGKTWHEYAQGYLNLGHKILISACWYVNYINYGESWRKYYECDPILDITNITQEQKKLVLGGTAAIWGEFVDKTNIIPRLFPFVSAVAEKLWSSPEAQPINDVMHRLDEQRCRLLKRGIQAQPILNGYCEQGGVF